MKKFYDREHEMTVLRELQRQSYNDYSRFVVLTGRRRVGKTSLVYKLISETKDDTPGLYFFVGRKTETVLVRTFVQEVREKLGEFVPDGMTSFRELFQMILEIGKRKKFTLFIDEFQEFDNINTGIFSNIQERHILRHSPGTMVPSEDDGELPIQADWWLVATEWRQRQG